MTYYTEIVETLHDIESRLKAAENRLNYTTDELMTDSIIFEMKSLYKQHTYYLRLCKELTAGDSYAV